MARLTSAVIPRRLRQLASVQATGMGPAGSLVTAEAQDGLRMLTVLNGAYLIAAANDHHYQADRLSQAMDERIDELFELLEQLLVEDLPRSARKWCLHAWKALDANRHHDTEVIITMV